MGRCKGVEVRGRYFAYRRGTFQRWDIIPCIAESAPLPSRILVLDDEPVLRALVARILTEAGYHVATLRMR